MPITHPPYLPDAIEDLTGDRFINSAPQWLAYIRESYDYLQGAEEKVADAAVEANQAELRIEALEQQVNFFTKEKQELQRAFDVELDKTKAELRAVINYQEEQLQKKDKLYINALREKDRAVALATPAVNTPQSPGSPEPQAEKPAGTTTRTPAPAATAPSESSRASERLPDPDKFNGDRKDLRRFVSQIHEKLTVNRDRFPSSQSRCSYVTSRLSGQPYAQILPYIHRGVCQLNDYEDILDILDRAFGDPNRVNNARNELFQLRQANKDFSSFFAEFQRLALEGEMAEDALPTLLEQAVNRELRSMLMHHEPPSRNYLQFATFLQDLENRRRQYGVPPATVVKPYAQVSRSNPVRAAGPLAPVLRRREENPSPALVTASHTDPMDLSSQRAFVPNGRRERGECYRCGSKGHLVAQCPEPDTRRFIQARSNQLYRPMSPPMYRPVSPPTSRPVSPPTSHPDSPSASVTGPLNGVSLN